MPVQISYKKQFVFFVLLTIIFLIGIEVLVNIWLYTIYRCDFEDNEIFEDIDPEINRKVCLESIAYGFGNPIGFVNGTRPSTILVDGERVQVEQGQGLDEKLVYINNAGFRSPDFTKAKQDNTYRIFAVGGSTTFGIGVLDYQTFPFYLQELYDDANLGLKVEVINTGWPGKWSLTETELIKDDLINYEPNLFIIYDGWNDFTRNKKDREGGTAIEFKERWIEICDLGKQHGFDAIITLHPTVGTGKKVLTEQEYETKIKYEKKGIFDIYPSYVEQLDAISEYCYLTVDLRGLFDNERGPIFIDKGHTGAKGNQIVAQKFYSLSLPLVLKAMESPDFNLDYDLVRETNTSLISNDKNDFIEEFFLISRDLISNYKTPRIFSLIFE